MKILLISGHGAGDTGALGCGYRECDLTREMTKLIKATLKDYATVDIYDTKRNAYKDITNGAFKIGKYDYALEVHFNAYNGTAHGTEIFVTTREKGITVEQGIMQEMKKYFTLRDNENPKDGVKRENFLVINTLKDKGISASLLETCFIDNKNDMKVYQEYKNDIANDIALAIARKFGLKKTAKKPAKKTVKEGSKVKVSKDATVGGKALNRGNKASSYLTSNTFTVLKIDYIFGVKEAKLSCNTWVAVKYLTAL